MKFTDLEFYPSGFAITREDDIRLFFPYGKCEFLSADPSTGKMKIEIKKYGSFIRDYESVEHMNKDAKFLLNKGRP